MSYPWFATSKVLAAGGAALRPTTFPSSRTIRYPTVIIFKQRSNYPHEFALYSINNNVISARYKSAESATLGPGSYKLNGFATIWSAATQCAIRTVRIYFLLFTYFILLSLPVKLKVIFSKILWPVNGKRYIVF